MASITLMTMNSIYLNHLYNSIIVNDREIEKMVGTQYAHLHSKSLFGHVP